MKIFYRRPLSLILCIMLGGFSLFAFTASDFKYLLFIIPPCVFGLSFSKSIKKHGKFMRYAAVMLLISLLFSLITCDFLYKPTSTDGDVEISGKVANIKESDYSLKVDIITDEISGETINHRKLLLITDKDFLEECKENTKVSFVGKISNFDSENESYYRSLGYSGMVEISDKFELHGDTLPTLSGICEDMRQAITEYMINVSDESSGGLLSALLLGERNHLDSQLSLDFKRIGITHMLALSGTNLTILVIGFSKILAYFGVNKKLRYVINIIITLLYLALTGFQLSVVRAGVMLIIASLLFLFARSQDSITAVFTAVAIIFVISPTSVFDIGLWLSALATLGILVVSEMPKSKNEKKHTFIIHMLTLFKNALVVSLFAVGATFLLTVFFFNEISVISPFATMLFSIPLEAYMYLGIFVMLLGRIIPVGNLLVFSGLIIKRLAAFLSELENASVSTLFPSLRVLTVAFSVLFFLFFVLDIKRKRLAVGILSSFMIFILGFSLAIGTSVRYREKFLYHTDGDSDIIYITGDNTSSLIDESSHYTGSAYSALEFLSEKKLTYLDNYVITSYSEALPSALEITLSRIATEKLYIPEPMSTREQDIHNSCLELADTFRTEIITYSQGTNIKLGKAELRLEYRKPYAPSISSGRLSLFTLSYDEEKYMYASSGILNDETKNAALEIIPQCEHIIFGRHGADYHNYGFSYKISNAESVIFSSESFYIEKSIIDFYENNGTKVYIYPSEVSLIH